MVEEAKDSAAPIIRTVPDDVTGLAVNVAFSGNRKWLASATEAGNVIVWDMAQGKETLRLGGHAGPVQAMAFAAEDKLLATGGTDGTIRLWDMSKGRERCVSRGHTKGIVSLSFSPDETVLISREDETAVRLWNVADGHEYRFRGGPSSCSAAVLSPDGKFLATASGFQVHVWDARSGELIATLEGHTADVNVLAFSPDGQVLTSESPVEVKTWSLKTRAETASRIKKTGSRLDYTISPDGKSLLVYDHHVLSVRDLLSGEQRGRIEGVTGLPQFGPDGNHFVVVGQAPAGNARTVPLLRLWDAAGARELAVFEGGQGPAHFSPDGKVLAGFSAGNIVTLWDAETGKERGRLEGTWTVVSLSFHGEIALVQGPDRGLALWDGKSREQPKPLAGAVLPAVFSPDGKVLATGGPKFAVQLWDVAKHEPIACLERHKEAVESIVFAPDGRTLVSMSRTAELRTVQLWDIESRRERGPQVTSSIPPYRKGTPLEPPLFTSDGKTLLWGLPNEFRRLEVASGKELPPFTEFSWNTEIAAVSPNGHTVVFWSNQDRVVANLVTGRARVLARNSPGRINWWFTCDGKRVINESPYRQTMPQSVAGLSGGFQVFDAEKGQLLVAYDQPLPGDEFSSGPGPSTCRFRVRPMTWPQMALILVDESTGQEAGTLELPTAQPARQYFPASAAALSPDGKVLATLDSPGGINGTIHVWDVSSGLATRHLHVVFPWNGHTQLMFDAEGKHLLALARNEMVHCDPATGRIDPVPLPLAIPGTQAVRRDGQMVAYAAGEEVRLFEPQADKIQTLVKLANVLNTDFSPDGRFLAIITKLQNRAEGELHVLDVAGRKEVWHIRCFLANGHSSVAFSEDSATLAVATASNKLTVWDLVSGRERATFPVSPYGAFALAPDGRTLVMTDMRNHLTIREIAGGKELHTLPAAVQSGPQSLLKFSPDGTTVLFSPSSSYPSVGHVARMVARPRYPALLTVRPGGCPFVSGESHRQHGGRGRRETGRSPGAAVPLIVRNAKSGRELHLGLWQAGNGIMSFSPDGKFLACAGDQSTQIRLWDFERQALRYLPRNHTGGVLALAFSPDGKTLASAGLDQTVRLWEVPSGQEIAILDGLTVNATLLGFTADGKSLISAAAAARQYASKPVPGEVKVWDLGTHKQRSGFALTEPSECLALSPDGATLVAAGPGGKVAVWDVMAAKQRATLTAGAWVYAAAFSSDGKSLATSYQNEPPRLWDLATGQERKDFFHSKPSLKWTCRPSALAFSADGKTLYAVGYFMVAPGPNEYALWNFDAVTGEDRGPVGSSLSADLAAGVGRYNLVASDSSSDGKVLATAWNQLVDVWELTAKPGGRVAGHLRTTLVQGPNSNIRQMVVSPDGNSVATADNTTAYLWDTRTGRQSTLWDSKPAPVSALQFSPDAKRLAVAAGNEIRLFDTETGVTKRCLTGLRAPVSALMFRPDSGILLSRTSDGQVKLWDLTTGEAVLTTTGRPTMLAIQGLSPDGKVAVTRQPRTPEGFALRRWDLASGHEIAGPELLGADTYLLPDQTTQASVAFDASLRFLDAATRKERSRLALNPKFKEVECIFSPNGERVCAIASEDEPANRAREGRAGAAGSSVVQFWDLTKSRLLLEFRGLVSRDLQRFVGWGPSRARFVSFSPNGRYAALLKANPGNAGGTNINPGEMLVMDLDQGAVISTFKPKSLSSVFLSVNGKVVATGDWEKAHLWDVATGEELRTLAHHPGQFVNVLGFALEDSRILLGLYTPNQVVPVRKEESYEVELWDPAVDELRTKLRGARGKAVVSPNGRSVAAVLGEGTNWGGHVIQLWDVFTGQPRAILRGHRNPITNLWFTPDGETLISQGGDATRRWQAIRPDTAEEFYRQGRTMLWKMQPKLQAFQTGLENRVNTLVPAANCFVQALENRSDHPAAYAGLALVLAYLEKASVEDRTKLGRELFPLLRRLAQRCRDRAEAHFLLGKRAGSGVARRGAGAIPAGRCVRCPTCRGPGPRGCDPPRNGKRGRRPGGPGEGLETWAGVSRLRQSAGRPRFGPDAAGHGQAV